MTNTKEGNNKGHEEKRGIHLQQRRGECARKGEEEEQKRKIPGAARRGKREGGGRRGGEGLTDGRHERGDDEGDDEGLERAQEQLPDVAHVHHLTLRPSLAAGVPAAGGGGGVSSQCLQIT